MILQRDIDSSDWRTFSESFSNVHRGWLTEATRREPSGTEHKLWDDAALQEVTICADRREAVLVDDVVVVTATTPDAS